MRRWILATFLLAAFGCSSPQADSPTSEPESIPAATHRNPKIPIEVSYPIIEEIEGFNATRRTIRVRLNMRVPPEVLREIALELKATERKQYERTLIWHYLPKLVYDAPEKIWATTHFDPTLSVEIMGLTKEQEEELCSLPLTEFAERIGAWLIDTRYVGGVYILHPTSSSVKLTNLYPGGGKFTAEVVEQPSEKGRRFKKTNGGDVYAVDDSGVLRLYDGRDGHLVDVGEPLK